MKKFIAGIAAAFIFLFVLNSCTLNNANSTPTPTGAFLVAQASPDAPRLNITINNNAFDTGLLFGTYTPYITSSPGTYTFAVISSGSSLEALSSSVDIYARNYYSYFIIDSFKKVKSVLVNDVFKAPAGDSTYIRFFNFCPNVTPSINLYDSTHKVVLSSNRSFNDQGYNPQFTAFNEVPSGTYILSLKNSVGAVLKTQTIALPGGKVFTLFAKGLYGNTDTTKALSLGLLENYPQK